MFAYSHVHTKGPRSAVTCLVSSGAFSWPSALLANVVQQEKREGEWGDFFTVPHRRETQGQLLTNPPTHSHRQTHFELLLRMAWQNFHLDCQLIRVGSLGFEVGNHRLRHTYTPL